MRPITPHPNEKLRNFTCTIAPVKIKAAKDICMIGHKHKTTKERNAFCTHSPQLGHKVAQIFWKFPDTFIGGVETLIPVPRPLPQITRIVGHNIISWAHCEGGGVFASHILTLLLPVFTKESSVFYSQPRKGKVFLYNPPLQKYRKRQT